MKRDLPGTPLKLATLLRALAALALFAAVCAAQNPQRGIGIDLKKKSLEQQAATPVVAELPGRQKRWALVIGVDQYKDTQIGRLNGAANDAHTLADALVRYAGFPADQVILLATDQPDERQPTRVNVLRRLSNLAAVVPKDGLLLVSFSGHGMERGGQAFLLPSDAQISGDVSFLEDTAISVARVKDRIKQTGVGQVIVLLDACRNDPGGRADAPNTLTNAYTLFNFDVRNREVQAFATIYATAVGQRAYEYSEKRQGYFTWALVEGLRGGAANERGEVTLAQLVRYVQETVPKRIGIDLGAGKQQRPFAVVEGYKAEELVLSAGRAANASSPSSAQPNAPAAIDGAAFEMSFWETIKNSSDPSDFRAYLDKFPNGTFAALARRRAQVPTTSGATGAATPAHDSPYSPGGASANAPVSASVRETLDQATRDYQDKSYAQALDLARGVLASQPDNGRANAIAGLSYLEMRKYTNSANHLAKAVAAGERVDVPVKHHHIVFLVGDVFCEGYVSFTPTAFEFHSNTQAGHDFSVPYGKLYEMVAEPTHGGRLRVKVGLQKETKEDKKTYNFYLTRAYTQKNAQSSVMDAHCDGCLADTQELSKLFQQIVIAASAAPPSSGAQGPAADANAASDERAQVLQELLEIERRGFDAVQLGDRATVASLVADEFVQKADGKTYTKSQLVAAVRPSPTKLSCSYEGLKVELDGERAVLSGVGVLRGQQGGSMVAVRQRFTDVFVRRDGRWLMLNSEVTTLK